MGCEDAKEILDDDKIIASVRQWVECFVVGMNLCPFAKRELVKNRVCFKVTAALDEEQLLMALQAELEWLNIAPSVETTLLIHPKVLQDFHDYNLFLGYAKKLLVRMKLVGVYQIASFHPDYQFGGTDADDVENYTNRSPYPMLHLIRENSIERVIAHYANIDQIPSQNIAQMHILGQDKLQALMRACLKGDGKIKD